MPYILGKHVGYEYKEPTEEELMADLKKQEAKRKKDARR